MRLLCINGTPLTGQVTGIERYASEVVKRLDHLLSPGACELLIPNGFRPRISLSNIRVVNLPARGGKISPPIVRSYLRSQGAAYVSLSGNLCVQSRSAICIHDIRPWVMKIDPPRFRARCAVNFLSAKTLADIIVTDSRFCQQEIENHLGISPARIRVLSAGWEHVKSLVPDPSLASVAPKGEYFYTLGSFAPHKNLTWVLKSALVNTQDLFLIAGGTALPSQVPPNVRLIGRVTDEQNKWLMSNCRAFLLPSRYEGFGIPPLEALACGAPVCVSRIASLPEVYGSAVRYFDPDNPGVDLDALLAEPVKDSESVLTEHTWEKTAQGWYQIINELCEL